MNQIYPEDFSLLQNIREGDTDAFRVLYEKYWKEVYSATFKRLKDHEKVQDIIQDIFTNLWINRKTLRIDNLPAYLHTAVRNRVLNIFEKEKRYVPFEQLLYDNIQCGEQADAVILRHEFLQAYQSLVNSLPSERKKIFHYFYEDGLSTDEIAQKLSVSRKTVQNQLGKAVSSLKAKLSHLFTFLFFL